jgi:universal stress protein A
MSARRDGEPGFEWPRYSRVLVALDETPAAAFALRHAVPYALDQRSQLTLLAVVPNVRVLLVAAGVSPELMAKQMEKEAADRLREIASSPPQEISVTTLLRHGDPAEEILTAAREQRADVICLGARGRGRVAGALLGSVSSAVLRGSPVPVVVWHPPPQGRGGRPVDRVIMGAAFSGRAGAPG